jgi:hypothetical protein
MLHSYSKITTVQRYSWYGLDNLSCTGLCYHGHGGHQCTGAQWTGEAVLCTQLRMDCVSVAGHHRQSTYPSGIAPPHQLHPWTSGDTNNGPLASGGRLPTILLPPASDARGYTHVYMVPVPAADTPRRDVRCQ